MSPRTTAPEKSAPGRTSEPLTAAPLTAAAPAADSDEVARLRIVIGKLSRRLRVSAAHAGMTPTQMTVLNSVVRHGPVRMADLQAIEEVNPTMLSRIVGKLSDAGLVTRVTDPEDRRAVTVAVTADGRRLHQKVRSDRNATVAAMLEGLPPGQARAVLDALPALEALAFGGQQ
jgi:DNA-binding MarR family transcriptional regulator